MAAGSGGAITGEEYILCELPLARGEHYRLLHYLRIGMDCRRATAGDARERIAEADAIAGI